MQLRWMGAIAIALWQAGPMEEVGGANGAEAASDGDADAKVSPPPPSPDL